MIFELFSTDTELSSSLFFVKIQNYSHIYTVFSVKIQYLKQYKNYNKTKERISSLSVL